LFILSNNRCGQYSEKYFLLFQTRTERQGDTVNAGRITTRAIERQKGNGKRVQKGVKYIFS
jgi:hypothetical protein